MVAIRQAGVSRQRENSPPFLSLIPKECEMPTREGPIWPVSANTVRLTLQRSRLDTLRKPDVAMIGRSDRYGWARYTACVADSTYHQYDSEGDFYQALIYAFCEPISDWCVEEIDEGVLVSFTLYASLPASRVRKQLLHMEWESWAEKYR